MPHHLLPLLFVSFLCASLCHSVPVTTADDLISLFKHATGNTVTTNIELLDDLDFSSSTLTLPLGAFSNGTCVSFSGVFQGNGHSIKGLKMNNTNKAGYKHAGLFCSLKDATVENLVIDSSCSFTGDCAGALSVSVTGSLTVKHTTNNAAVNGSYGVGGFIGYVEDMKQATVISFEHCANNAIVTVSDECIGGFVGLIQGGTDMTIIISNSNSNGNVTGGWVVGGFVGIIQYSTNMNIIISNSINNGIVTWGDIAGGLVGAINCNSKVAVIVSNSTNCGSVNGESTTGGFVGYIGDNTNMNTTISNSINNGNINGSLFSVGGFVGWIDSQLMTLSIMNSANKGSVSCTEGMACGLVYVASYVNTTMKNTINKGSVRAGTYTYGITNNITMARNVVSMGDVTGSSGSFTFWKASTDVHLFYGLDGKCNNCGDGATLFQHNTTTGFYEVVGTGEHVDELLNDESVNQHFGMMWTKELDLVFTVNVSGLWNASLLAELGTPLNEVGSLSDYFNDEELCVGDGDNQPRIAFKPTHPVSRNMKVVVGKCMDVTVGAPINKSETMIAGETLDHLAFFFGFSLDDFIVVEKGSQQVLNESSMIERDTVLKLCHNVIVSGLLNQMFVVEYGTTLGQISALEQFFNSSFIVYDNDKNSVLTSNTTVPDDIIAVITKVSQMDVVIKFDEDENITVEEVESAIKDLVKLPDDEHVWIEVISQGDNSFIISIKQTSDEQTDIVDLLKKCSLSKQ